MCNNISRETTSSGCTKIVHPTHLGTNNREKKLMVTISQICEGFHQRKFLAILMVVADLVASPSTANTESHGRTTPDVGIEALGE